MQIWVEILLSLLAGPLLISGVAKLFTPRARIPWPVNNRILWLPLGPRLAGGTELAALVLIWLGSAGLAAGVATVGYALLTGVGWRSRGQRCGCFGPIRMEVIGPAHLIISAIGVCLSATLLGLSLTLPTQPRPALAQRGAAIVIAGGFVFIGLWLSHRLRTARAKQDEPCRDAIGSVHLYVSQDCAACRALEVLLASMETDRRAKVIVSRVGTQSALPSELAHLGMPCVVPLSPTGEQVCSPVGGLAAAMRHIQAVTLATPIGPAEQLH